MNDIKKLSGFENPAYNQSDADVEKSETIDEKIIENKDEEVERAQWGNSIEFLMSCIAMSVGLGNIWRFPFVAYQNGGGAFLVPYIIVLTVIGRPLYYMEMSLGQFSNKGNVKFYTTLSPYLKGVGVGQVLGALCVATYYCCLMAITLFYLVNSFTGDLPWGECTDEWRDYLHDRNLTCIDSTYVGDAPINSVSSSEIFFKHEVLKEKDNIDDGIGYPEWRLTLCLLGSWLVTFLVSYRGVKSSGKASYFLAIFPYIIMLTLLIRAATLDGASEGMYYFIKTDWSKLAEPEVWYAAVTQCFFSLNVGFGSIIMFSSYNDFRHNINRDALIVTTLDTFTSLLSGVTIFGILGNLAHNLGVTPDKVINSGGTSLAFISYPDAIAKMDAVPWLFAILFFFMLFVLGIGSLVALHGTVSTILFDLFPKAPVWMIAATSAIIGFVIGLMYVTPGGQYMLTVVDHFGGTFIIYIFVIMEVCGVAWFYGLENFTLDLEYMLNRKVNLYWRWTWGLITPVLLIVIFVYTCVKYEDPMYGDVKFPIGALMVGWSIFIIAMVQFIAWIPISLYQNRHLGSVGMFYKTFGNDGWGPNGEKRKEEWKQFKENALSEKRKKNRNFFQKSIDILCDR